MHIRNDNIHSAIQILKHACNKPAKKSAESGSLMYNINAWSLYIDLLESQGEFELTKSAYERVMTLKIATPGSVLNFADFLQRNRFYEESFRVYERAVLLFEWPRVYEIWLIYISKMVEKYAGSKLERIRHLFEQALKGCPVEQSKLFMYMYADFEENFGLLSHAMEIYERAVNLMKQGLEQVECINVYIAKATQFFGIAKTR